MKQADRVVPSLLVVTQDGFSGLYQLLGESFEVIGEGRQEGVLPSAELLCNRFGNAFADGRSPRDEFAPSLTD
ncbi:hypothetical protein [Bradyrhizobium sp. cf659]|uniref:hypothetical protein n=1 Tax=Bradyrhizobium sp. cf659 TaxID=1761771 RepID=UPI001FCD0BC6|nr:hypothetical protein [Bradyrhizobium sp. cf659]